MSLTRLMFAQPFSAPPLRSAIGLVIVARAALVCCLAGCQPPPTYYQVASSSMAPALTGPALRATCHHCQHTFNIAADTYRDELVTRCAKCGGDCHVDNQLLPGQRVAISPLPVAEPLERFELIAFEDPTSGAMHVKRIWGLPGEAVTLSDGEVYIESPAATAPRMLQKTLAQLRQLSVPVSNYPDDSLSHWYVTADGDWSPPLPVENFLKSSPNAAGPLLVAPHQRLQWRHQRPAPVHTQAGHSGAVSPREWLTPSSVVDDYECNQGISCQLNAVDDYLLQLELLTPLKCELQLLWRRGESLLPIIFFPPDSQTSDDPQAAVPRHSPPAALRFKAVRHIEVAWCDQRLLVMTDQEKGEVDAFALAPALQPSTPAGDQNWQLQMEAEGELQLSRLLVARDLYFPAWRPLTSDTKGYFVMGDNLPVSIDSRGSLGRIAPQQLVGRVENVRR